MITPDLKDDFFNPKYPVLLNGIEVGYGVLIEEIRQDTSVASTYGTFTREVKGFVRAYTPEHFEAIENICVELKNSTCFAYKGSLVGDGVQMHEATVMVTSCEVKTWLSHPEFAELLFHEIRGTDTEKNNTDSTPSPEVRRYYLARFLLEALFWNDWEDEEDMEWYLGKRYLSRKTRELYVAPSWSNPSPPQNGGIFNFRLLNRQQRIQAWLQGFLILIHPECDNQSSAIFESAIYAAFMVVLDKIDDEINLYVDMGSMGDDDEECSYYLRYRAFAFKAFESFYPTHWEDLDLSELPIKARDFRRLLKRIEGRTEENEWFFKTTLDKADLGIQDKMFEWQMSNAIPEDERKRLLKKYAGQPTFIEDTKFERWQDLTEYLFLQYLEESDFNISEGTNLVGDDGVEGNPDIFFALAPAMQINLDYYCVSAHMAFALPYEESYPMLVYAVAQIILSEGKIVPTLDELRQKAKSLKVKVKKSTTTADLLKKLLPVEQLQYFDDEELPIVAVRRLVF